MLLTSDARALAAARRPAWFRFVPGVVLLVAAAVLGGLHATFDLVPLCTDAEPCAPAPFGAVAVGLAFAAPFAALASTRVAAGLACGFLATDIVGQLTAPQPQEQAVWLWLLDAGYAALALIVALAAGTRRPGRVEAAWTARAEHRTPPGTRPGVRRHGFGWRLAAVALFVVAAGIAAVALAAQAGAQAQQESARRVAGEVTGHPDEFTVQVRLATGDVARIEVVDVRSHPVGARRTVLVDDEGLRQLAAEPYDATGWLALAVIAAGVGVALLTPAREPGAAMRALFTREQPASRVYVRPAADRVAIYAADARPGEPAVLEMDLETTAEDDDHDPTDDHDENNDQQEADEDDQDDDEDDQDDDEDDEDDEVAMTAVRPAVLYGVPAPGHWCAVEVDGRVLVPRSPVRVPALAPAFTTPPPDGTPIEVVPLNVAMPRPETLPLRPEEVAALRPEDRDTDPDLIRTHRRGPLTVYGFVLVAPLSLWGTRQWLPDWPVPVWVLVAAAAVALTCYGGWRVYLRPALSWNGAGISAVGVAGAGLLTWNGVDAVELDTDGSVHVRSGDGGFLVTAHQGGPLARLLHHGERSGTQLVAALRLAQRRAREREEAGERDVTTLPPPPAVSRAPVVLWCLGLAEIVAYAWLLSSM
ncbi:hypothetical protein Daura_44305 [Dactylosporangium aurantiacum]|uniref:Uncharacterized protein n=1 Tax=Dactylosporangium aurantiacum TaxID=35754 RepID=A0A9Q9II00_9ACTN|nr:hypothetical protein [Dactylosporangium aurantiacum]MDG6102194.1 hypothetical protein [Dactylosporangium aurantiacum]UWZ53488.1 hypothetical protein Daura_44305 [Dactylosporangium aurantiacum]